MNNVVEIKTKIQGMYKIEAVRPDGSKRLLADWFPNLITDGGLDQIGQRADWLAYCVVGSGNTAPANSDTSLVSFIAATSSYTTSSRTAQSSPPYYGTSTQTYRFAIGVATGNLSEVGISPVNNGTTLFSRALILDGLGSPTTITVLAGEALDVTYQLLQYVPTSDVTGTVTINSIPYAYTMRAAFANGTAWAVGPASSGGDWAGTNQSYVTDGTIGAITGQPSGTIGSGSTSAYGSYTPGNYYLDTTISYSLVQSNVSGGIGAMLLAQGRYIGSLGAMQVAFVPSLPKDGSHTMTLVFRHSWARH